MVIDDQLLNRLEKLSALKIREDKKEQIKEQFSEIVDFVEILNELDLDKKGISLNGIKNGVTPLREDVEKTDSETIEIILKNTKNKDNHSFVVPKIIE